MARKMIRHEAAENLLSLDIYIYAEQPEFGWFLVEGRVGFVTQQNDGEWEREQMRHAGIRKTVQYFEEGVLRGAVTLSLSHATLTQLAVAIASACCACFSVAGSAAPNEVDAPCVAAAAHHSPSTNFQLSRCHLQLLQPPKIQWTPSQTPTLSTSVELLSLFFKVS
jgi:hypothetical protein